MCVGVFKMVCVMLLVLRTLAKPSRVWLRAASASSIFMVSELTSAVSQVSIDSLMANRRNNFHSL